MENFIDYVICSLMTCSVESRKSTVAGGPAWVMTFEDRVTMTFVKEDVNVVREIYEERKYCLDADDRAKYQRFFSLCQ